MGDPFWPLFDLRVRTPRIELRPPREADLYDLVRASQRGVHDPATMPFLVPWTDTPSPRREREAMQWWWRCWATWTAEQWHLPMAVVVDGEIVGVQDLDAEQFPVRRVVTTGSWLTQAMQGRGIGKEMRLAALHLAFVGLHAQRAETGAFADNEQSLGVTRSLGYRPNGTEVKLRRGEPAECVEFVLARDDFERIRRDDIVIEGLDAALPMFGLAP